MRTRPRERSDRSRWARRGRRDSRASPTRRSAEHTAQADGLAAVEASPAPSRAQRRAGALHGGRHDVTPPQRRNAGDGGLDAAAFRAGYCTAQAVRPARPLSYRTEGVSRSPRPAASEAAGLVAHSLTRRRKQTA